ncbi:Retrovirus-related Pol polyprotein from transposon RE1 [Senna tora]|uniref:Retrovirus-related Pol polyprotein from transposon RE1 n=1 Tax=Senna tora TaxID=362788 RepID=A0A834SHK7_9FABA|nr:Retrovirus-related Pol polyprotein from transposon RE1 [Senna tora]
MALLALESLEGNTEISLCQWDQSQDREQKKLRVGPTDLSFFALDLVIGRLSSMVTTQASSSSASVNSSSSSSKSYSLFSNSTQNASIKLDRTNYLLWRTMVLSMIEGNFLESHINGTRATPPSMIEG